MPAAVGSASTARFGKHTPQAQSANLAQSSTLADATGPSKPEVSDICRLNWPFKPDPCNIPPPNRSLMQQIRTADPTEKPQRPEAPETT